MTVHDMVLNFKASLSTWVDPNEALREVMDWDSTNCDWAAYALRSGLIQILERQYEAEQRKESS